MFDFLSGESIEQEEEMAKKIAQNEQRIATELKAQMVAPKPDFALPNLPVPEKSQTFMDQMQPYMDKIGKGAQSFAHQGFVTPNIAPVQRDGGVIAPQHQQTIPYGPGIVAQMDKGDNKSDVIQLITKMMGG